MNDMVRRTRSTTCTICNSHFKRLWLESQPKQTEEEVEIVEFYEKKHRVETIRKIYRNKIIPPSPKKLPQPRYEWFQEKNM